MIDDMDINCGDILDGVPIEENQLAPRRRMVGATAIDSTLLTVVGQP